MNFKSVLPKFGGAKPSDNKNKTEKRLYAAVLLVLSLFAAYCFVLLAASAVQRMALSAKLELANSVANRRSTVSASAVSGGGSLSKSNMFGSVLRTPQEDSASAAENFVLKGTLPRVGAWISDGGETRLILVHQEIGGWTLEDVSYGKVLLSHNGESCALYISLVGGSGQPASVSRKQQGEGKIDFSAVRRADKDKDGYMPREVLDKLLLNPYDEVGKMKMTPADGGGMKIERIASDSVLGMAGVAEGDVIKAVNGVNISNLGDLSNAINSLMSGSRFDVAVQRGGSTLNLKYDVN